MASFTLALTTCMLGNIILMGQPYSQTLHVPHLLTGALRRHASVTDVFLDSVVPLYQAVTGPEPLIRDRRFKLVPAAGGFKLPSFYHWLLLPFSKRPVC